MPLSTNSSAESRSTSSKRSGQRIDLITRLAQSPISTPFDLDANGKQEGHLRLYHSNETNGYGFVPIPIVSIKNGAGPTALLIGGNHGNEYEGIVALMKLAREIGLEEVQGRIIFLPSLNHPAVLAGTRSSPLDGANLNRSFPGSHLGGPTQVIAHYVSTVLIPISDVVIDLHAGGRSSKFMPCGIVRQAKTPTEREALTRLAELFGAPISFVSTGKGGGGVLTLAGECSQQGVACLTAELGGGETLSSIGLALAGEGVRRILADRGILSDSEPSNSPEMRWVQKGTEDRLHADKSGIFEPRVSLGQTVLSDEIAGFLHLPEYPTAPPQEVRFRTSGTILSLHVPALVGRGDELCTIVHDKLR